MTEKILQGSLVSKKLADDAAYVANASTELSARLELAEAFLQSLPAKAEVLASIPGSDSFWLQFGRQGDQWRLIYHDGQAGQAKPVTALNVLGKARAAILLPKLLRDLVKTFDDQRSMLSRAHRALDEFDELCVSLGKEDK